MHYHVTPLDAPTVFEAAFAQYQPGPIVLIII
jgi:hypothetical protein